MKATQISRFSGRQKPSVEPEEKGGVCPQISSHSDTQAVQQDVIPQYITTQGEAQASAAVHGIEVV